MFDWLKKRKKQDIKAAPAVAVQKEIDPFEQEWQAFIKGTTPCENPTIIERKLVADDYMVSKDHKQMMMYLEESHNEVVSAYIEKNYNVICRIFEQWGYTFMYAPREVETIAQHYGAQMPDVEWNAATLLEMQGCHTDEPIGTAIVTIEDVDWDDDNDRWVATMRGVRLDADNEHDLTEQLRGYWKRLKWKHEKEKYLRYREDEDKEEILYRIDEGDAGDIRSFVAEDDDEGYRIEKMIAHYYGDLEPHNTKGEALHTDDNKSRKQEREERHSVMPRLYYGGESSHQERDEELGERRQMKIIKSEERKCQRMPKESGFFQAFIKKTKSLSEKFATEFLLDDDDDKPELLTEEDEQLLLEIQERIMKLHHSGIRQQLIEQMVKMIVEPSPLQVTDDARLILTDYNMEVTMLPIDKVVYIFYLRHPEGVAIKMLEAHKEELIDIYIRILGKELTANQRASVERLCNPLDNSINEKISRIRQAFRAVAHDSIANNYIISGSRGEERYIALNEDLIIWNEWGKK